VANHATNHDHEEHGLAHVASMQTLVTVGGALLVLTVITVLAAQVDFGGKGINLAIAMLIAAFKASLVVLYFMHIRYDRPFHGVLIIGGLLAAALFVCFALVDRSQYEHTVIWDKDNPPAMAPRTGP
jgi:cytochrome c oxidase subunit IV